MRPNVGIGILSWKAHDTLRAALSSYQGHGVLDAFDKKLIYFSDMSDEDIKIAQSYGWDYAGGPNTGIAGGMEALAKALDTDYVLLLQNDNPVVMEADFCHKHIANALELLESGRADLVRMRHRWQVGEGFADVRKYLRFFGAKQVDAKFIPAEHGVSAGDYKDSFIKFLRRTFRPIKAKHLRGRGIFIETAPQDLYPHQIRKDDDFLLVDSQILHFTDQCLLIKRSFFLDVLMDYVHKNPSSRRPNGFQAPEICLNGRWWRGQHYIIAQGEGLFTHDRKDGSFRIEHPAFEADIVTRANNPATKVRA